MNLIKEARIKKGWTQKKLAHITDKSVKTIQSIEQGIRRPSPELTIRLFKLLKIPIMKYEFFLSQCTSKCSENKKK